jgi:hypothetical protein
MKKLAIFFLLVGYAQVSKAQNANDIMVGGGIDLIKTDLYKGFDKAQVGFEANYFVVRHFAVGAGAEWWTGRRNSFVMGMRWYADDKIFLRFRGLIGANDASLGAGWSQPIHENWRLEAIGDFYFRGDFALRAGVSFIIP